MQLSFDFLSILDLSVSLLRGPQTEEAIYVDQRQEEEEESVCRERTKLSSYIYLLYRRYTISQQRSGEAVGGIAGFPIFPSLQQLVYFYLSYPRTLLV